MADVDEVEFVGPSPKSLLARGRKEGKEVLTNFSLHRPLSCFNEVFLAEGSAATYLRRCNLERPIYEAVDTGRLRLQ